MKSFLSVPILLLVAAATLVSSVTHALTVEDSELSPPTSRTLAFLPTKCGKVWGLGTSPCVCTEAELVTAIKAIPSTNDVYNASPTKIVLCRYSSISLTSPIDLSNKAIDLQCGRGIFSKKASKSCVIDGGHKTRLFEGHNARVTIRGVVLIKGVVPTPTSDTDLTESGGAALALFGSTLTLDSCRFSDHMAHSSPGGAIYFAGGNLNIESTEFVSNSAKVGGAIAIETSNVNIAKSSFQKNRAEEAGGAIQIQKGKARILKTTFFHNAAKNGYGGGILLWNVPIKLIVSTFSGNSAKTREGVSAMAKSGFDIYVSDDEDPSFGGTVVTCDNTVFCNGRKGMIQVGTQHDNIKCNTSYDIFGPPGLGRCP